MQPQQPYIGPPQAPAPNQAPQGQAPLPSNPYDFIVNPGKPPKAVIKLGGSMPQRLLVAFGGLLVLVIIAVVVGKLLSHTSAAGPSLVKVAQEQQELLNIVGNQSSSNSSTATLSANHQNVAATVQLVITSNQSQLLSYVSSIGYKYTPVVITGYTSSIVSSQLSAGATNGTYDSSFASTLQNELSNYELALKLAYTQVGGPKGQALLSSEYNQAQLLVQQLASPAS